MSRSAGSGTRATRTYVVPFAITAMSIALGVGVLVTSGLPGSPVGAAASCDVNVDVGGGHGPITTIQAGIDAATAGQTVCVYPGLYNTDHATARNPNTGGPGTNDFNIFVGHNQTGVTIQGVDTSGNAITTAPEGVPSTAAPVIEAAGIYPVFGSSNIFIQADNVTLRGFEINGDPNFIAKSVEIDGNGDTVTDDAFTPSTVYSGAGDLAPSIFHGGTGIYISDFNFVTGSNTSTVQSYTFTDNTFDGGQKGAGIYIASGAGWTGPASGRVISGNKFSSTDDAIDFAGPTPNIAWLLYPVGAATITGNTFANTSNRHVLVWGSGGPGVGYASPDWCGIMSSNTFDAGSFTWQGSTTCPGGTARTWSEPSGSGGGSYTNIAGLYSTIQKYGINKSVAGDTVQVLAGTYNEDVTIGHQLTLIGAQASVDARTRPYPPTPSSESIITGIGSGYTWPVWVQANDVKVDGFTVEGGTSCCGGAGVYLVGTHGTQFVNNIVANNTVGLFLANSLGSDPTLVQHNLFADNTKAGAASGNDIYADEFTAGGAVNGATINANRFTNSSFVDNGWAVDLSNIGLPQFSNVVVSNNTIDNHGRGVVFYGTTNSSVTANTFTPGATNHYGVLLCGDDPSCYVPSYTPPGIPDTNISVTLNSLGCASCVGQGVEVLDANGPSTGVLVNRNDLHGLPVGISNNGAANVDGTCNWWGSASGPAVGQSIGAVTSAPWLTAASPLATAACNSPSAPTPPTIGFADNGGVGVVSVFFTPGANGGSPITSFTATCTSLQGHGSASASGSGSPILVTGLVGNTPYSCSVTATNLIGTSGPSGASNVTFPASSTDTEGGGGGGTGGCTVTPTAPLTPSAASEAFPGAAVSWAPPHSGCIAGYIVTPYLNGVAQPPTLVPGTVTTTVIRGLIAGDSYRFTVAAENGSVAGPASVMTSAVTIGTPGAAAAIKVAKVGKGAVKVTFTAAKSNGAPIKRYTATCTSTNGGKTKSKVGKASPLIVSGLTVGKTYSCSVTASNGRGTGPASRRSSAIKT